MVTDAATGQPIEGVQVRVQGTGLGAATQGNGRYFIINVPPGTYSVEARRIGYRSTEKTNVSVRIDVTRDVDFALSTATTTLSVQRVVAEATPLVEVGITGSSQAITTETIQALPVTNVAGVLALQQGFFEVPQNTDITSFSDTRRNVLSPIRIRGGRGGETQTLIDGIPINNVVFGDRAFDLNNLAVQQIDFQKGGFEPQYGNALSGIVNIATREGGTAPAGNIEYQSSGFGGRLGLRQDELRGFDLLRGFLSGAVPGTGDKLRFAFAGQTQNGADAVIKFDNDVYDFDNPPTGSLSPEVLDMVPGYRAFGYDTERDVFGKLTWYATPTSKLHFTVIDYERQRRPFDYDFLLVGFDPYRYANSRVDSVGLSGFRGYRDVVQGSVTADRTLYSARFEQQLGRSALTLRGARFDQERNTCNYFQGVCLGDRFADMNYNNRWVTPGVITSQLHPAAGTDIFYGGESARSWVGRADLQSQVTDHHNLLGGLFYQTHDLTFRENLQTGVDAVFNTLQRYAAKPWEAAAYFQDRIEYDFLTVKLGFRYDYARAKGSFFSDPLDPTNKTTALEVCNGLAPGVGSSTPYTYTNPTTNQTFSGIAACQAEGQAKGASGLPLLLDSARRVAQRDDFKSAAARRTFSPRIAVNFPLTESASLFFNAGRYAQNPLYQNLYQNTGVGTRSGSVAEGGSGVCDKADVKPGTNECHPTIASPAFSSGVPFLGNPNLLLEQTTSYEAGYAANVRRNYAINLLLFSKDQTGLSGIRASGLVQDPGATYNGQTGPRYRVIVNQDYATARGLEMQLRRRVVNYFGFDINYSYSKTTTNSPPPGRAEQAIAEGDSIVLREVRSEIDQPHVFNASLIFQVGDRSPGFRYGGVLRNVFATLTAQAASGLPYTPTRTYNASRNDARDDINTGRGPATFRMDLLAGKDFALSGMRYGVFMRVLNLTDRENCVQVFVSTGRCDSGTIDQRRRASGQNQQTEPSSTTEFDRPDYRGVSLGARRAIIAGGRVSF